MKKVYRKVFNDNIENLIRTDRTPILIVSGTATRPLRYEDEQIVVEVSQGGSVDVEIYYSGKVLISFGEILVNNDYISPKINCVDSRDVYLNNIKDILVNLDYCSPDIYEAIANFRNQVGL